MHGTVIDFSAAGLRLDVCRSPFGLSLQPWMFGARGRRGLRAHRETPAAGTYSPFGSWSIGNCQNYAKKTGKNRSFSSMCSL